MKACCCHHCSLCQTDRLSPLQNSPNQAGTVTRCLESSLIPRKKLSAPLTVAVSALSLWLPATAICNCGKNRPATPELCKSDQHFFTLGRIGAVSD